jgi:hypothetical protein
MKLDHARAALPPVAPTLPNMSKIKRPHSPDATPKLLNACTPLNACNLSNFVTKWPGDV